MFGILSKSCHFLQLVSTFAILTSVLIGVCIGLPILVTNVHDYFTQQSYAAYNGSPNRWLRRHYIPDLHRAQEYVSTGGGDVGSDSDEEGDP